MIWFVVLAGSASAICWFLSAIITPDLTASYWGGPPPNIERRARWGSWLNGAGAFFASVTMGAQAYLTYIIA